MAELLVRVIDKVNKDDPYLDAKCLKRGDVVCVMSDGHAWSPAELKSPHWRVLHLPSLSVEKAEAFLGPEIDEDPKNPSKVLRRRALLPADVKQATQDGAKVESKIAVPLTEVAALALKVAKPRLEDPNVFEPVDPGGVKG